MWSPATPLPVSPEQRRTLEAWTRAHKVRPAGGRPRTISAAKVAEIVHLTLNMVPKGVT
jgi:hypothetical protein